MTAPRLSERALSAAFEAATRAGRRLPYARRIAASGALVSRLAGPLGWRKRISNNLDLAWPDCPPDTRAEILRGCPDNIGRSLAEIYSGAEFTSRIAAADPLEGPGLDVLADCAANGRGAILACAHLGNYDAMRAALAARGWPIGALYRPMRNAAFNRHYERAIHAIAEPLFARDRRGLAAMLRHLREGGFLALGFDQFDQNGAALRFFGRVSATVLTPAELAIKHGVPLIPVYPLRQADGLSFRVIIGAPVAPAAPEAMMQELNDALEDVIRRWPSQWLWTHRRWKPLD